MKIFNMEAFGKMENTDPDRPPTLGGDPQFVKDILTNMDGANDLNGHYISFPPGTEGIYHYHKKCESLMVIIGGEAVELVEGKEIPLKVGDVIYIPAGEKHSVINRSDMDFRFFEFFSSPPVTADKFAVE